MAQLHVEADPVRPGCWSLRSQHPAVLAAVPDALAQVLDVSADALAAWALHPDEQAGLRDEAYRDEIRELGHGPVVEVVELARPWQQNVVWVDRYHLLVAAAPPSRGSRLLGLYVASPGRIVIAVHHASVAGLVQQEMARLPADQGRDWDSPLLVSSCRFVLRFGPEQPDLLQLRAPQPLAQPVQEALTRLGQLVTGW